MRVILLGRKPIACATLRHMISMGIDVPVVVAPGREEPDPYPERLVDAADALGVPVMAAERIYELLGHPDKSPLQPDLGNIDLVVSVLHQKRILRPLIELGRIGCINFHPAPLPEYRGWGTYSAAVLEDRAQWGASAHFVDDGFDTGPLIRVKYFDVDCRRETALSLQLRTQPVLFNLFREVLDLALSGEPIVSVPQATGRSFTRRQVMAQRFISPTDSPEMVNRKVRAFWYPPNPPAEILLAGSSYALMNRRTFEDTARIVCAHSEWTDTKRR